MYSLFTNVLLLDCSDSDIRLVSGNNALEGTVEVCYYNIWGLVSDSGWSNKDAQVVCRQLNYNSSGCYQYNYSDETNFEI